MSEEIEYLRAKLSNAEAVVRLIRPDLSSTFDDPPRPDFRDWVEMVLTDEDYPVLELHVAREELSCAHAVARDERRMHLEAEARSRLAMRWARIGV